MLMLFKKVLRSARIAGEKKSAATNLRRLLRSIFNLVKAHCARGQTGIASVVFNELSGLTGSSTIRRFNRTLSQTYGLIRGRQVPAGRTDATFNIRDMAPFRQPIPRGGRAAQPPVAAGVRRLFPFRGNGAPARNRGGMRCYICDQEGHGYQQCPRRGNQHRH